MMNRYVLITPACNEEAFIRKTIESVIHQTVLPVRWIIVNDGSIDHTANIVEAYTSKCEFMELINLNRNSIRVFSSKVRAFNSGFERVKSYDFNFIGNLDADIAFDKRYFERILEEFQKNSKLGIAGGNRFDLVNGEFIEISRSLNSVSGAVQLFRRECFSEIGGYLPLDRGGIDSVAESMARFQGWEVKTFPDVIFYHYRRTGTAENNIIKAKFNGGIRDYLIGYHPFFEIFRIISRIKNKPFVIGSLVWFLGYLWANIKNYKRPVPANFIKKLRKEQINRLKFFLKSLISS